MHSTKILTTRRSLKHRVIKVATFALFLTILVLIFGDFSTPPLTSSPSTSSIQHDRSLLEYLEHSNLDTNDQELGKESRKLRGTSPSELPSREWFHHSLDSQELSLSSSNQLNSNRNLKDGSTSCINPGKVGSQEAICAYIASNCPLSGGYINYLDIFYCSKWLGGNRALGWVTLVAWLLFLFAVLGLLSNEYFVPVLTSISYTFSIPAEIAGLTLLAFANGAPNVASYFAAVSSNSFDFAIGDVFGGSLYVTCVVGAAVCFAGRDIALNGYSFMRDLLFLTGAIVANFIIIWTGRYYIYESIGLLVYYIAYVLWASIRDLMAQRKKRLKLKEEALATGIVIPPKRSYKSQSSIFKQSGINHIIQRIDTELEQKRIESLNGENPHKKKLISSDKRLDRMNSKDENSSKISNYASEFKRGGSPPLLPTNGTSMESSGKSSPTTSKKHVGFVAAEPPLRSSNTSLMRSTDSQTRDEAHLLEEIVDQIEEGAHKDAATRNGDSGDVDSSGSIANSIKSLTSTRTLRRAFALGVTAQALLATTHSTELDASVEDILAPPLEGETADDNAVNDGSLPIPNVHLYQEAMEEELTEKEAYIWSVQHWKNTFMELNFAGKIVYIMIYPVHLPFILTVPVPRWNKAAVLASFVVAWVIIFGAVGQMEATAGSIKFPIVCICIAVGAVLSIIIFFTTSADKPPKFKVVFLFWSFIVAVLWIYLIANELLNVLQVFGKILNISDLLIGATALTWGNSVSDFAADTTCAARGEALIALGAIIGGPTFNVVFGIGTSTLYATIRALPKPFYVSTSPLFFLMATYLLVYLATAIVVVPFLFKFRLRWFIGIPLAYYYVTYFIVVVLLELGVIWKASA